MTMKPPVLAITPGEPAGIGPEILLRFHQKYPGFRLLAVADPDLLKQTADSLALDIPIQEWRPGARLSAVCFSRSGSATASSRKPGYL